ncbi:MAG: 1,4-dihydroxy-6-naphthoate synthase [Rikenellaceae bacterium]|nr:1,4-dihydroxy-6-naphthoate synthase [Rikenellaceae bacterium]
MENPKQTLKIHISTCPNDTFMFDALLHHRIDTEGLEFETHLADIEALNDSALQGVADITKCSYAVVPALLARYQILNSGSALGRGNGPLLVSRKPLDKQSLSGLRVAIPGERTTANLLLQKLFPEATDKQVMLFSDIIPAIARGEVDAGVLIHEGRFLYREKGLSLIADLGLEWEAHCGLPLPLGAIAVRRTLPEALKKRIDSLLSQSVRYAFSHPEASRAFVKQHAQELDDTVIQSHISLFVNDFSIDLGPEGRHAVTQLLGLSSPELFLENPAFDCS